MLISLGRLAVSLIWPPNKWGWSRGTVTNDNAVDGQYLEIGPIRLVWWLSQKDQK